MPATEIPARLLPFVEELLDNEYARANLRDGATKLRDAYERTQSRRVESAKDGKLRAQLTAAVASIGEGTQALATGRQKPKGRTGKRLLLIGAVAVVGAGVAVALNDDLRAKLLGGNPVVPPVSAAPEETLV